LFYVNNDTNFRLLYNSSKSYCYITISWLSVNRRI